MSTAINIDQLKSNALDIRKKTLYTLLQAGSGHPGGSLSMVEILTTLFFKQFNWDEPRDRFILSKGHGAPSYYAALAVKGLIEDGLLKTFREIGSPLQGHPVRGTIEAIDASTGSLGQGLSMGIGYALASRLKDEYRHVYVVIGDGESQEGQIWEAAMSAAKYKLDNLTVIVDYNKIQNDGHVNDVMSLEPLFSKWKAFNWNVQEINGHNMQELLDAYQVRVKGQPQCIIAHTVKGKGISFMENQLAWNGKKITQEIYDQALEELDDN